MKKNRIRQVMPSVSGYGTTVAVRRDIGLFRRYHAEFDSSPVRAASLLRRGHALQRALSLLEWGND